MSKKAILPIIIFVLFMISLIFVGIYIHNKKQEEEFLMLKQKYEPLNSLNLQELDKMPNDKFRETLKLYDDYRHDIRIREGKNDKILSIVPNIDKISQGIGKVIVKRDKEKRRKFKLEKENKNYERFLRECKRITDENIIKEKLARLDTIREIENNRESNSLSVGNSISSLIEPNELKAGDGITEEEVKERKEFIEFFKSFCD